MFRYEDEYIQKILKKHEVKINNIENKLSKINETIAILEKFAEVKIHVNDSRICEYENCFK